MGIGIRGKKRNENSYMAGISTFGLHFQRERALRRFCVVDFVRNSHIDCDGHAGLIPSTTLIGDEADRQWSRNSGRHGSLDGLAMLDE